ncbi:CRISPR-associated helicase Cas3' [Dehalogenimonas sp. THU2]|uniref:CRISPR-associated helicase Cas3' n=1 Tax=Dehalogenimonas sp. THU2 TaxID=3151121 RepID=UPI0032185E5B
MLKNLIDGESGSLIKQSYYARIAHEATGERKQALETHLINAAGLAAGFAADFSSADWGYLAGLWHDLGKYQQDFQRRLNGEKISVEHSGLGAVCAMERMPQSGFPLAFAIAGHHGELADLIKGGTHQPKPLKSRLTENTPVMKAIKEAGIIPEEILERSTPELPDFLTNSSKVNSAAVQAHLKRSGEMWTRFLFSSLIDADRLDSEKFGEPEKAKLRAQFSAILELNRKLDEHLEKKVVAIPLHLQDSEVNRARRDVLNACRLRALDLPGLFSLIVPTGGGKTLSAMSFALRHAAAHGLHRVIVVIPYTSIIEQNAKEYRQALGDENIIEHHSSYDPQNRENGNETDIEKRANLATENWEAPLIVTTSVQFLETLFSSSASRCRKLHNIARSVIILDEVQTLPPGMLASILDALQELTQNYGCSLVLSTATPPALLERPNLPQGLKNVRQIIAEPEALAQKLKRVNYLWPESDEAIRWETLIDEVAQCEQVLVVVHRRQDARDLAQALVACSLKHTVFHLSALMCPAHRLEVIARIKERLKLGMPTRVVSTQLVEAGVDFDFPIVYRALGGLDSIVQAAGRCNREGRSKKGKVVIFRAPSKPPPGTPRKALDVTETMLRARGGFEPDSPEIIEEYFRRLYLTHELDCKNIQREREEFNFATVGREFRLIEDGFTESIVVPYEDAPARLNTLRQNGSDRKLLRSLQPFVVNVYPKAFKNLLDSGYLLELEAAPSLYTLRVGAENLYDDTFGLTAGDESTSAPALII